MKDVPNNAKESKFTRDSSNLLMLSGNWIWRRGFYISRLVLGCGISADVVTSADVCKRVASRRERYAKSPGPCVSDVKIESVLVFL